MLCNHLRDMKTGHMMEGGGNVTMLRSPVGRCPHAQPQGDENTSRCDKVARLLRFKIVVIAHVVWPPTLQTNGEREIVKLYP